ncbi:unnamed protein product [Symbiodinium natans]|uniref:Uncharacterized protein n=1 Tax=Symbiodinium natans TaxID=878477 RepID=A0A812JB30_9DINO|nr:unnamed protein product [Symbiodinium natans]
MGGAARVLKLVDATLGVAGARGLLRLTVRPNTDPFQTPPLLPVCFLEAVGAVIGFPRSLRPDAPPAIWSTCCRYGDVPWSHFLDSTADPFRIASDEPQFRGLEAGQDAGGFVLVTSSATKDARGDPEPNEDDDDMKKDRTCTHVAAWWGDWDHKCRAKLMPNEQDRSRCSTWLDIVLIERLSTTHAPDSHIRVSFVQFRPQHQDPDGRA